MDFWVSMGISLVLSALQAAVKNPASKETMRRAFQKVYLNILLVYPEFADPKEG